MLDFIGLVITAALMVLIASTLTIVMDASRPARITLAAVIGVWIGLAAAVAQAGWLPISRPIPVVGLFVAAPLLAAALGAAWPTARHAMLSIPWVIASTSCASSRCCFCCSRPRAARVRSHQRRRGDITGALAVPLPTAKDGVAPPTARPEPVRHRRSGAGDCLRHLAEARPPAVRRPGLAGDAICAVVVVPTVLVLSG